MICLTFDTDWMTSATLADFLRRVPMPGRGTFFCHEFFPDLERTEHELGPHPFIERLSAWHEATAVIADRFAKPPRGLRAHSCVFSHMIGIGMHEKGYRYVSQAAHLYEEGLRPYRHPWGIWELPIYYMDNMDFWTPRNWTDIGHRTFDPAVISRAIGSEDLFVFDVHPIHIALNTRSHEDYVSVKDRIVVGGESPFNLRFPGRGAAVFFEELCDALAKAGEISYTCSEALRHFGCK